MRDDSTGGWVPVGGGGLSNVSVQKQKIFHEDEDQLCKHEYLIDGKRISDEAVSIIIECSYGAISCIKWIASLPMIILFLMNPSNNNFLF